MIVGPLLPFTLLQFSTVSIKFHVAPLDFTGASKEVAMGKGKQTRDDREGSLARTACRILCVCVRAVTHRSRSHPAPLHLSLFIPESFGHLTKTNDSASKMSSSLAHKQVERGGGGSDGEHCNHLVPLFSVWLRPPLWGFEIVLRMQQP